MKTDQPNKEMESIGDAARRLLAEMEERLGRPSGEKPERIMISPKRSPGEKSGSSQAAKNALELLPPVARRWAWGGVRLRQGSELNVLFIQTHANLNDDDWLW